MNRIVVDNEVIFYTINFNPRLLKNMYQNFLEYLELNNAPICIIGGGIGGLATALAFLRAGIPSKYIQVFEKDPSFHARRQGYGLTIQQGTSALKELGIAEMVTEKDIESFSHYIFKSDGSILGVFGRFMWTSSLSNGCKKYNLHLPRQALREVLYDSLPDHTIVKWGKSFKSMEFSGSLANVTFDDDSCSVFSLVIGCDGIYSRVRKFLLTLFPRQVQYEKPLKYLGVLVVLGILDWDMNEKKSSLPISRVFQTLDGRNRLFIMPFQHLSSSKYQIMWQLSFPLTDEPRAKFLSDPRNLSDLRKEIKERIETWHDPIPEILLFSPDEVMASPVYDRDPLAENEQLFFRMQADGQFAPVTLLGDAFHPMSPFKGQGANQALLDAVSLCKSIVSTKKAGIKSKKEIKKLLNLQRKQEYFKRFKPELYDETSFNEHKDENEPGFSLEYSLLKYERETAFRSRPKVEESRNRVITYHEEKAIITEADGEKVECNRFRGISPDFRSMLKEKNIGSWTAAELFEPVEISDKKYYQLDNLDRKVRNAYLEYVSGSK